MHVTENNQKLPTGYYLPCKLDILQSLFFHLKTADLNRCSTVPWIICMLLSINVLLLLHYTNDFSWCVSYWQYLYSLEVLHQIKQLADAFIKSDLQ